MIGNLFADVPQPDVSGADAPGWDGPHLGGGDERFDTLAAMPGTRVERIVSTGQRSPPGFWYDQDWDEFVLLVSGAAVMDIAGQDTPRLLQPGDWLHLPAHTRHRILWTPADRATVWLAVHTAPQRVVLMAAAERSPLPPS